MHSDIRVGRGRERASDDAIVAADPKARLMSKSSVLDWLSKDNRKIEVQPENKLRTKPQNPPLKQPEWRSKKLEESATYMMYDFPLVPGSNPGGPTTTSCFKSAQLAYVCADCGRFVRKRRMLR
jgi:hypothetical protein